MKENLINLYKRLTSTTPKMIVFWSSVCAAVFLLLGITLSVNALTMTGALFIAIALGASLDADFKRREQLRKEIEELKKERLTRGGEEPEEMTPKEFRKAQAFSDREDSYFTGRSRKVKSTIILKIVFIATIFVLLYQVIIN